MAKSKKTLIKEDLQKKMQQKNLTSPLYLSLLDQYMDGYTQICDLKRRMREATTPTQYVSYSNQARQVQKSMLNILGFLKIDPAEESAEEEDYDL